MNEVKDWLKKPGNALLLAYLMFISFAFAGTRPLWAPDEGRYAEAAREMLVSGDWLVPRIMGHEHLTKPPLTYWFGAASMGILGVNEWGARLPSAFAFLGTTLCVMALASAWGWSRRQAIVAGVMFSSAPLAFASGHLVTTDMILTLWETLGVLAAWKVWGAAPRLALWRWIFWLAFGLAFLTKGPPGWLPISVIFVFILWRGGKKAALNLWSLPAFLFFLALSFSWFAVLIARDRELINYFVKGEVYNRIFTSAHHRDRPFWIYPPIIFGGFLPWALFFPGMWKRVWPLLRNKMREASDIQLFSLLWLILPFVIFTLAKSRMPLYVVPLFVPLSLWTSRYGADWLVTEGLASKKFRRYAFPGVAAWALLALALLIYPDSAPLSKTNRAFGRDLGAALNARQEQNPECYAVRREVPDHLAFYSGALIPELDIKNPGLKEFNAKLAADGKLGVYVIRRSYLKRARKELPPLEVIAEDHEFAAYTLQPAAPEAMSS